MFIKDIQVDETLKGFTRRHNGLVILKNHRVVLRRDFGDLKHYVKIIAGGGSGHEPAFAGFVGPGMLTAAVLGEIFTSPSPKDILQTIRHLAQEDQKGILLIVSNNMGDRLAFGVAYERAIKENIKVKMILVSDDYSSLIEEKTCSSGIILLYKFAGALAQDLYNLDKIYEECVEYMNSIKSSTMLFKNYTYFDHKTKMKWESNEICIGMGLQGEPSGKIYRISNINEALELFVKPLIDILLIKTQLSEMEIETPSKKAKKYPREKDEIIQKQDIAYEPVILLINILPGSHIYEMNYIINCLMNHFEQLKVNIKRCVSGTFYSCLDAHGLTISVLPANSKTVKLIDSPCSAPDWPRTLCVTCLKPTLQPDEILSSYEEVLGLDTPPDSDGPEIDMRAARTIKAMLICAIDACISCDVQLKILDVESKGKQSFAMTTIFIKLREIILKDRLDTKRPKKMLKQMLELFESESTGYYGVLYALMIECSTTAFDLTEDPSNQPALWVKVLELMVKVLTNYGASKPGDGTILDVLSAVHSSLEPYLKRTLPYKALLQMAAESAEEATAKTTFRKGQHYQGPDAECQRLAVFIRALNESFKLLY